MNESIQHKISRVRPPRVQITYDLHTDGAIVIKELPFIIAVIADLYGDAEEKQDYFERKFIYIDKENFTNIIQFLKPSINITFKINENENSLVLKINSMADFHPTNIIEQTPILKELKEKREKFSTLKIRACNNSKIMKQLKLLSSGEKYDLSNINFNTEEQKNYLENLFEFYNLNVTQKNEESPVLKIQKEILEIDTNTNIVLNQILHNKKFQRLEGTYRGLEYLIKTLELGEFLKVRVFSATFNEIDKDLSEAMDFDQSYLFKKIYEEEYGTYGGQPYGYLIFDYYIKKHQTDFVFLHKFAPVMAAAHTLASIGVDASLFEIDSFTEIGTPINIHKAFESPELAKFTSFRNSEDSRYISFILPRYMARLPYGEKFIKVEGTSFEEEINGHEDFLWGNAVYVYASNVGNSFSKYGWLSSIIGPENGGAVTNLPVFTFQSPEGDRIIKCPTEVAITDRREKELSNCGFISLCYCKDTDFASFFSGQSGNKPLKFDKPEANANAELSARIQYMLNVSRFAHYIKCMMRDKIGSFSSIISIQRYLEQWISKYVLLNETTDQKIRASYPLSAAKIIVTENPSLPGGYSAILFLRPAFQMEELTVSLRLVATLPI